VQKEFLKMSIRFNPLGLEGLDIVGSGGGGSPGPAQRYVLPFNNSTDWTLNAPDYTITISAASHGSGVNPNISVFELVGSIYELVQTSVDVNASGDVTIKVSQSPDNRFNGLVLII